MRRAPLAAVSPERDRSGRADGHEGLSHLRNGQRSRAAHLRLEVDLVRWQLRANCCVPRSGHLMSRRRRQRRQWQLRRGLQPPSPLVADPDGLDFE